MYETPFEDVDLGVLSIFYGVSGVVAFGSELRSIHRCCDGVFLCCWLGWGFPGFYTGPRGTNHKPT